MFMCKAFVEIRRHVCCGWNQILGSFCCKNSNSVIFVLFAAWFVGRKRSFFFVVVQHSKQSQKQNKPNQTKKKKKVQTLENQCLIKAHELLTHIAHEGLFTLSSSGSEAKLQTRLLWNIVAPLQVWITEAAVDCRGYLISPRIISHKAAAVTCP